MEEEQQSKLVDLGMILPIGNELEPILGQREITVAFLNGLLRKRKILSNSQDKEEVIQLYKELVLTPIEIKAILQQLREKEENLKIRNEKIELANPEVKLSEIANNELVNIRKIGGDLYGNFNIVGTPSFARNTTGSTQTLTLSYTLEKRATNADYIKSRRRYQSEIALTKKTGSSKVIITSKYSANETREINSKLIKKILKKGKKDKLVKKKPSEKITFGCFTNAFRVRFLLDCLNCDHSAFFFDKITDLDLKPDENLDLNEQEKLAWISDKVSTIRLSGQKLEETFFITDNKCHPYILIWRLEVRFRFSSTECKGMFKVLFIFTGNPRSLKDNYRFDYSISEFKLDSNFPGQPSEDVLKSRFQKSINDSVEKSYSANKGR